MAAQLLHAFDEKRLNKQGYAFILTEEVHFLSTFVRETVLLAKHGLLFVAREESWMATTREEAEARVLTNSLTKLIPAILKWNFRPFSQLSISLICRTLSLRSWPSVQEMFP